jgi:hypothetical protein
MAPLLDITFQLSGDVEDVLADGVSTVNADC